MQWTRQGKLGSEVDAKMDGYKKPRTNKSSTPRLEGDTWHAISSGRIGWVLLVLLSWSAHM